MFEGIGINLGYLLVHSLNFIMMILILSALVYGPVLTALDNRRQKIAKGLEDARVAAEARQNAEREANQIITEAQSKATQIIREATERADVATRELKAQGEAEAAHERELARAQIEQERERILTDLRGQVAALSLAVAQKIIGESLDEKRQHALINEFFSGVRGGQVIALQDVSVNGGGSAEVVSALPLTVEEKEAVKTDVLSRLGSQATVSFRVDPGILGGLIVRVGDKVWDASIAGQLDNLRHSLA
jgi:F-type H+-transporting ATPase subunit b